MPKERKVEAALAAEFMGAQGRENLGLPDGGIQDTPQNRILVASAIRRYRPKIVVGPLWEDRHPDHVAAGQTI
jgi:LmbE family N-acetylglucosaminyl deacetylase